MTPSPPSSRSLLRNDLSDISAQVGHKSQDYPDIEPAVDHQIESINPSELTESSRLASTVLGNELSISNDDDFPTDYCTMPQTSNIKEKEQYALYVGDLHPEVNEVHLLGIFQSVGPVKSVFLSREKHTCRSRMFAYIYFHELAHAKVAYHGLNYYSSPLTKSRPIRLMWMDKDPTRRISNVANVFVKNLGTEIDAKHVHTFFEQFGKILSCKLASDDSGSYLGYGFIQFDNGDDAKRAIDEGNGMIFNRQKLYVSKFLCRYERDPTYQGAIPFTNLYFKGIDRSNLDRDKVREVFEKFGEIQSMHFASRRGIPLGYGYVNYMEHNVAKRALRHLNGKYFMGKILHISPAKDKATRDAEKRMKKEQVFDASARSIKRGFLGGTNLYLKNISHTVDEERLLREFTPYGKVTSCTIMRDRNGYSRCFGFVCFADKSQAAKAIAECNGRVLEGYPMYVAIAQKKADREKMLRAQYSNEVQNLPIGNPKSSGSEPLSSSTMPR